MRAKADLAGFSSVAPLTVLERRIAFDELELEGGLRPSRLSHPPSWLSSPQRFYCDWAAPKDLSRLLIREIGADVKPQGAVPGEHLGHGTRRYAHAAGRIEVRVGLR